MSMSSMRRAGLGLAFLIAAPMVQAADAPAMSAEARAYLDRALTLIAEHAYFAPRVDLAALRAQAEASAAGAETTADTYPAIRAVLVKLMDNHGALTTPDEPAPWAQSLADTEPPQISRPARGVVRVRIDGYRGSDPAAMEGFVRDWHLALGLAAPGTCGWVVDLRRNAGGNLWPMLAALGPLLGDGDYAAFEDRSGARTLMSYRAGTALDGGQVRVRITNPVRLAGEPPVAVLLGPETTGSGEALAAAFIDRPETRSFGLPTYGVPTRSVALPLSDGAELHLTTQIIRDRKGWPHESAIPPDQAAGELPDRDFALTQATEWLHARAACQDKRRLR